jgi:hypothetical protein
MYAIKYFRDAEVVRWYEKHGIFDRPVGYVVGKSRFETQMAAQREADHINQHSPTALVTVVRAS